VEEGEAENVALIQLVVHTVGATFYFSVKDHQELLAQAKETVVLAVRMGVPLPHWAAAPWELLLAREAGLESVSCGVKAGLTLQQTREMFDKNK
jgi:hypothetical protein